MPPRSIQTSALRSECRSTLGFYEGLWFLLLSIDLGGLAKRLWAVKLAALHRAAADAAGEELRR